MVEQKTVFISYRRSTSQHLARSIYQDLKMHGWDAFLDVTTIDSGDFDRIILNQIGARAHFILLISRDALQRCTNRGDWVLREIDEAVRQDRNIVPIIEEDADFNTEMAYLPKPLRATISRKNALPLNQFYFDSGMEILRTRFLKWPDYITINEPSATEQAEVNRRIARIEDELTPPTHTSRLIVDPHKNGYYRTINAALKAAPPGAYITVRPGIYQERLVLDKPITIEGEGGRDQVIVQTDNTYCLVMQTDEATVSGLGLRCVAGSKGHEFFAVDIPQGRLILHDCDITSDSLACVAIHNAATHPYIANCTIHDGKEAAVFVHDNGAGVIENCELFGNTYAGIQIDTGGNPTLRGCTIRDNRESGVYVLDNGAGLIEQCQIIGNGEAGVLIETGGDPIIRGCTITQNGLQAIQAHDGGRGTVEDCDLRGNKKGAWDTDDSSSVQRSGNKG